MENAFRILGFKVHGNAELLSRELDEWLEILDKDTTRDRRSELLYNLYKDVEVVVNQVIPFYWEEIMNIFPTSKFIFYAKKTDEYGLYITALVKKFITK
jgi:hypothetical protein